MCQIGCGYEDLDGGCDKPFGTPCPYNNADMDLWETCMIENGEIYEDAFADRECSQA